MTTPTAETFVPATPESADSGDAGMGSTPPPKPQPLYVKPERIYPRAITGRWRSVKWWALRVLLALYYIGPWLRWDRGPNAPDQALLIDMSGQRAYFFWIEIWPQEIYYLTGLLILGALGLFLATAWFGRVWCGFTCPQTVWTDLFMWVERRIEGDRNARMRLDKAPWSPAKLGRKAGKQAAWLLIAFLTGGAWIMYFNDAPTIAREFFTGEAGAGVYGFTLLFTMTTYVLAGWAREQVCIYMCPWPRFQSAMFDEDSLIVTYEDWRGEPRGGARHGQSFEGRGHCVDCGMCWQVCPTGVDIRKGQQMACIGCALCIDACNGIMTRYGLPGNLIAYDSYSNQLARSSGESARVRLLRPRTIIYMAILAIVASVMTYSLATRQRLEVNVLPDRQPLFVRLSDGSIRNGYTVKILNMAPEAKTYTLSAAGIHGLDLTAIGFQTRNATSVDLPVAPDTVGAFRIFVKASPDDLPAKSNDLQLLITDTATGDTIVHRTVFEAPGSERR